VERFGSANGCEGVWRLERPGQTIRVSEAVSVKLEKFNGIAAALLARGFVMLFPSNCSNADASFIARKTLSRLTEPL
jgi:hypothetical protein